MFDPTSRYYRIPESTLRTADGREIVYKQRRFLPDGNQMQTLSEVRVRPEDRLDLIAARAYGQPEQFWRICDANDAIDPFVLTDESGETLRVPIPQAG